jgi:hypothetical protein
MRQAMKLTLTAKILLALALLNLAFLSVELAINVFGVALM